MMRVSLSGRFGASITLLLLFVLCATRLAHSQKEQLAPNPQSAPGVEMANVLFRYSPTLSVEVVALRGTLLPTEGHSVPSFNDPGSFVVATNAAEFRMNESQLTALINDWLLRSPKAQLKNISIGIEGDQLRIRGTMKKGLHVPFSASAGVGMTSDNRIRISTRGTSAAGIPVKSIMDALGFSMENLVSQKGLRGLSVDKDSFLIDPQTAFPPPQIRARLAGVRVSEQKLVLIFGSGAPKLSRKLGANYIALRGGRIQYGREEMFDSNLTMIDSTPADPFDFYLGKYWCQMVAGRVKLQPDQSLRVYVPDFTKLPRGSCRQ